MAESYSKMSFNAESSENRLAQERDLACEKRDRYANVAFIFGSSHAVDKNPALLHLGGLQCFSDWRYDCYRALGSISKPVQ